MHFVKIRYISFLDIRIYHGNSEWLTIAAWSVKWAHKLCHIQINSQANRHFSRIVKLRSGYPKTCKYINKTQNCKNIIKNNVEIVWEKIKIHTNFLGAFYDFLIRSWIITGDAHLKRYWELFDISKFKDWNEM